MQNELTVEHKQPNRLNQVRTDLQRLKTDLDSLEIDTFEIEDIDDANQQAASVPPPCSTCCNATCTTR